MYVTKRGNKYRAWERVVIDGTVKRISVTMDRDTPQARRKAQEQLNEKKVKPPSELTYKRLVSLYIDYQKATVKMSTWTRNKATLERLGRVFGDDTKVENITAGFISSKLLQITKNPGTYNEYLSRVKALFRWAYQHDHVKSAEFVEKLKPLKDDKMERIEDKYLETEELQLILDNATPFFSPIFEFLALSGLRIGELIALEDKDVTETDIIVRQNYDSNNHVINTPKTPSGWRYVHIQPELRDCIRRIRMNTRKYSLASGFRTPYFVVNVHGGRLSYVNTEHTFKRLCVRVLGRELTLHALRHTHVSLTAENGVDLNAIARRCGHKNSKVTKDIYYHVTKKQREKDNAAFDSVSLFTKKVIPM